MQTDGTLAQAPKTQAVDLAYNLVYEVGLAGVDPAQAARGRQVNEIILVWRAAIRSGGSWELRDLTRGRHG